MTVVLRSLAAVVLLLAGLVPAAAQEGGPPLIDITRGRVDPLPIAIPDFYGNDGEARQLGKDIAGVVSADLESSGLFRPLDKAAFLQSGEALLEQPRFEDWRAINAQILVTGQVTASGNDLSVEFRLWDVAPGLQLTGMRYNATADNWRRIAHIIADAIYERITGEQGYFDTRIVFVAESGGEQNRTKRLAIMDQDGANLRYLTDGDNLVLTPRFSPTAQEITYMMYQGDDARVYLRNLDSGRQELVGDFDGMTFAPRFAPSGRSVLLSLARDGNSEIYAMDLATRNIRRLTHAPGIDTSPSAAPDGTRIAFNSDRGGSPQIYVMGSGGGNPQRISFGDGSYYTPVWSPRGDYIAFTKIKGGRFYIGVMAPDGSGERLLSEGFLVEGPTWAPNGRVLMYTRNDGSGPRLYSIDVSGYNERRIPTPTDASDPAWSPLLH